MSEDKKFQPKYTVIILENSVIENIALNAVLTTEFPLFKKVLNSNGQPAGCKRGCGGAANPSESAYREVKYSVANLPPESKVKLKRLLSVAELQVTYRDLNGELKRKVF